MLRAAPAKNRLCWLSAWQTPRNCRRFHDNLYQIHFSGFSALHESRRQSLPHPYSPLRAPTFFRISRNRVQANNPHLNQSFGMKVWVSSIGRLLFHRPVDRSRSISTVDKDSPIWEYGRYRRLIRIHLLGNTVDVWSTVDLTPKSVEIDRRYGFIPKKNVDVPSYQKKIGRQSILTVEVDMDSKKSWTLTSLTHTS